MTRRATAGGRFLAIAFSFLLLALVATGCGGGGGEGGQTQTETGGTSTSATSSKAQQEACLQESGFEIVTNFKGLPIFGTEGGPPILNGVKGVGVHSSGGEAVVFAYASPSEAKSAASVLSGIGKVDGNVVIVPDPKLSSDAENEIIACFKS